MTITKRLFTALLLLGLLQACDEGRIDETILQTPTSEGRSVHLTGKVSGAAQWPEDYSIVVAGFARGSDFASVSKPLNPSAEGKVEMTLSGITASVSTIEICVINKLRKRIHSWQRITLDDNPQDSIRLQLDNVDMRMITAIQQEIFDKTCTSCHGLSTRPAAGLNLMPENSYAQLVGHTSTTMPELQRVHPGKPQQSMLHLILGTNISANWHMDHSQMVTSADMQELITQWITSEAQSQQIQQ